MNTSEGASTKVSLPLQNTELSLIPDYYGDPTELVGFLQAIEYLKNRYLRDNIIECQDNHYKLILSIRNKLHGSAKIAVYNSSFETIHDIILVLKNNFADNRSVEKLEEELQAMKLYPNEHPISLINRLEKKRTTILDKHKLNSEETTVMNFITRALDKKVVSILVKALPYQLGGHLTTLQIKNLTEARYAIINNSEPYLLHLGYSTDVISHMGRQNRQVNTYTHSNNFQQKSHQQQPTHSSNFRQTFRNQQPTHSSNFQQRSHNQQPTYTNNFQQQPQNKRDFENKPITYNQRTTQNRENQTVSMRTVSNNVRHKPSSVHLTEETNELSYYPPQDELQSSQNDRLSSLEAKFDKFVSTFEHFLGPGQMRKDKT
jgi:hypothetical protein